MRSDVLFLLNNLLNCIGILIDLFGLLEFFVLFFGFLSILLLSCLFNLVLFLYFLLKYSDKCIGNDSSI